MGIHYNAKYENNPAQDGEDWNTYTLVVKYSDITNIISMENLMPNNIEYIDMEVTVFEDICRDLIKKGIIEI